MARPRNEQPTYKLRRRGRVYYVRWWADGGWHAISTRTDDRAQAARFLAQFEAGSLTPAAPDRPTIGTILDGYLLDRAGVAAPETLRYAANAVRRHLGELEPAQVSAAVGRRYVAKRRAEGFEVGPARDRRRKPVSDGTIAREIVTLRAALRWAVKERWITREDEPSIEAPTGGPPRDRWLSRVEVARLIRGAKAPHVRLFILLALHTAARSSALLELQWSAIDFERRRINLGRGAGNKGRAVVPINVKLAVALRQARKAATSPWVIEYGGKPVASVKTGFRAACEQGNLPGVTPTTLRHTAASWMAMARVPMRDIAMFLGHRNVTVTERVYAKFHPDYLEDAGAALAGRGGRKFTGQMHP